MRAVTALGAAAAAFGLVLITAPPVSAQEAPASEPAAATGIVTGQVLDDRGVAPTVACVGSRPTDWNSAGYLTARADAEGRYSLALPPGTYVLEVDGCGDKNAYAPVYRGGGDRLADSPPVTVVDGQSFAVDLTLPRAARVSGQVTYEDGQPAANQCVRVHGSQTPDLLPWVYTDAEGRYTATGVAPGPRRVHFGDCEGDSASYGQWWDTAPAYDQATPIDVAAAGTTDGINGVVRRYATLSGRVVDDTGAPVVGACAQLMSASGGGFTGFSGCTDGDGRWSIDQVRPSSYKIYVGRGAAGTHDDLVPRWYPGVTTSADAVPVVVSEDVTVPSIDLVMPHGGRVSGRVTADDGAALVGACVALRPFVPGGESGFARTDSDGRYTARGIELGAYRVLVTRCDAGNWAPGYFGAHEGSLPPDDGLHVELGSDIRDIDVTLHPGAVAHGRVVDSSGTAVPGVCVSAWGGLADEGMLTGADGSYTLRGLGTSADYYLVYRDCGGGGYATEYSGDTPFLAKAKRLNTTAGTTTTLPVTVLEVAGTVSGTVTDARTGLRVGAVGVQVHDPTTGLEGPYAFTDVNGSYRIPGIKPGQWAVRFYDAGANVAVPEYWDNAATFVDATPVDVGEAIDRPGVDAAVLLLTTPSVPRLPVVEPGEAEALLTWHPPVDDGSAAIDRYEIVDALGEVVAVVDGHAQQARVADLTPGVTYELGVRAVNSEGPGPTTELLSVTPRAPSDPEPAPVEDPVTAPDIRRLAGADRVATAIAIAQDSHPAAGSADLVVLARADAFADALAGAPLAAKHGAPLLLTRRDQLDERVLSEISRVLRPGGTVALLGGAAALDERVAATLRGSGYGVQRYAGATRFDTAVQIAQNGIGDPSIILVANGISFPDALSASAAASRRGGAVVLTDGGRLPAATSKYLTSRPTIPRWAIGGPAAAADPSATRVVGRDRYDTSVQVVRTLLPAPTVIGLASGTAFPDALAGSAHAASRGAVLLLTDPATLPTTVDSLLFEARAGIATGYVYGGPSAVSTTVERQLRERLTP